MVPWSVCLGPCILQWCHKCVFGALYTTVVLEVCVWGPIHYSGTINMCFGPCILQWYQKYVFGALYTTVVTEVFVWGPVYYCVSRSVCLGPCMLEWYQTYVWGPVYYSGTRSMCLWPSMLQWYQKCVFVTCVQPRLIFHLTAVAHCAFSAMMLVVGGEISCSGGLNCGVLCMNFMSCVALVCTGKVRSNEV